MGDYIFAVNGKKRKENENLAINTHPIHLLSHVWRTRGYSHKLGILRLALRHTRTQNIPGIQPPEDVFLCRPPSLLFLLQLIYCMLLTRGVYHRASSMGHPSPTACCDLNPLVVAVISIIP